MSTSLSFTTAAGVPGASAPVSCLAPARATRDIVGDGRRPSLVRRLFTNDDGDAAGVTAAMRRVCADEGFVLVATGEPLVWRPGATMRSVVACLGGHGGDARGWGRLIALAARDDVDLVAIIGASPRSDARPLIERAGDGGARARVAERRPDALMPVAPARDTAPAELAQVGLRVERLLADGRRSHARQVLAAKIARARRHDDEPDDLALRVALARIEHDDVRPAEVCRLLLPALQRGEGAPLDAAAAIARLDACLLACHASIDLLQFARARQLAGAAVAVAEALGARRFEAARAQWRVCHWMGDHDGALAQARDLESCARTAVQQIVHRRCALRTSALRWPDEAASHRQWLRGHSDAPDRERAGLARRALAEDAIATGDRAQALALLDGAVRVLGRRITRRLRASLTLLSTAVGGRRGCGVPRDGEPSVAVLDTPLMHLCRAAVTSAGGVARHRVEHRASGAGVSLAGIAPWLRPTGDHVMIEELVQVIEACHSEDGAPAMARLCSLVREQLGAAGVGLYVTPEGRPLAGVGAHPCVSTSVSRAALARNVAVEPAAAAIGVESAVPVRFGGSAIAALCCRWAYDAPVDRRRATLVLTAAAAVCAPVVQAAIEAHARLEVPGDDLGLIGTSDLMRVLRVSIRRAALAPFPVLIEGESGAGKELVARAIHGASARRGRRFCAVNCAAVSDDLLEAELFGHARGAFTGAVAERPGLFEDADGGTLFLDEVGELSARGQAKLLRVLQEGEVRRVGENVPRRLDVRIVAATNRTLAREVEVGRFRDDLRFRLDVVRIEVPPLRARPDDIEALAQTFWREALAKTRGRAVLDRDALAALARYDWPGNVRELQNVIATLAVRAPLRGRITEDDVRSVRAGAAPRMLAPVSSLDAARREFDAALLRQTLVDCGGRRTEAARRLGMTRQGLLKLMHRLGIDRSRGPTDRGTTRAS